MCVVGYTVLSRFVHSMTFAQRRNRLTTHFLGRIPVVKRHMTISGLFFVDPEDVRSLSLGVIWNFSKETGFLCHGIK
jgi:hypothetical protein